MPAYAYFGVLFLTLSELAMAFQIEPFWSWHTPIAWTGYILFIDGIIYKKRGSSWLTTNRREFWFLAAVSVPLWVVFEGYNKLIDNWHYVNLPRHFLLRYFGYAWAFATIWPAIFETAELVGLAHRMNVTRGPVPAGDRKTEWLMLAGGAVMVIYPILFPSPYLGALVFLGFVFLLDPINRWLGDESLLGDLAQARGYGRLINLLAGGLICGFLWEFWNYWARAKWIYDVPIMQNWKIFEMPVPGYFGFSAFAVECFTMYVFVRHLLWRGKTRPIAV